MVGFSCCFSLAMRGKARKSRPKNSDETVTWAGKWWRNGGLLLLFLPRQEIIGQAGEDIVGGFFLFRCRVVAQHRLRRYVEGDRGAFGVDVLFRGPRERRPPEVVAGQVAARGLLVVSHQLQHPQVQPLWRELGLLP